MANLYMRLAGMWLPVGSPPLVVDPDPDPNPEPTPADWQIAVDSMSFAQVEAWYAANTGHEALGLSAGDLVSGSLNSTEPGQVITGVRGSNARWAHSNVTYRGCRIEWSPALYGAYGNPTFGNSHTGILFDRCTFVGEASTDSARRAAVISCTQPNAVTFRNCNFSGGTSGLANDSAAGGAIVEYCWIHDLAAANSSNLAHRTSLRASAGGGRFFRNYTTDGGSSCISVYFDKNPVHDFIVQENIMNGSSPNASPSFLLTMKEGEHVATATNIKLLDNYFGDQFQFGQLNGVNDLFGVRGNEHSGSRHFLTGDPI